MGTQILNRGATSLTENIRQSAIQSGFDLISFAPADPLPQHQAHLESWCEKGYAGNMDYLKRNPSLRADPRKLFDKALSVITLGVSYFPGNFPSPPSPAWGRVARYAWGKDYHTAICTRVLRWMDDVNKIAGRSLSLISCTDAQPVMERALAEKSGLGFFGKNTNIIARSIGSWIFLTEILIDLALEPDPPTQPGCGACTKCLTQCPTNAFKDAFILDSRRCISYLTIENKGDIPLPLREKIGDWVFGCDICQEVCPYNRTAKEAVWTEFSPMHGTGPWLDLNEVLRIRTNQEFKNRFRDTAILRAKRGGLLRNACVVAGNKQEKSLEPALEDAWKNDSDALVRSHAEWALSNISS